MVDSVGVSVTASAEPEGRALSTVLTRLEGPPQARVVGLGTETIMGRAAWANGSLADLLDFDDVGFLHSTACILPAGLAFAEETELEGRDLAGAMVVVEEEPLAAV